MQLTPVLIRGLEQRFYTDVREVLPTTDFLMGSRVQAARFMNFADYERLKDSYRITPELLELLKRDALLGHAMPVRSEYTEEVKADPRNVMYQQVNNGKHIRQAMATLLLGRALPLVGEKQYSSLTEL
jgi:aspartate carbamoyltransferase catalytic subunit